MTYDLTDEEIRALRALARRHIEESRQEAPQKGDATKQPQKG